MRKFRRDTIPEHTVSTLDTITCDKCQREIDAHDPRGDDLTHTIDIVGNWHSPFGDDQHIECDLCYKCLHELIKDYLRVVETY